MLSADSTFLRNVLHVEACVGGGAAEEGRESERSRGTRKKGGKEGREGMQRSEPGGRDCFSFSALSASLTQRV